MDAVSLLIEKKMQGLGIKNYTLSTEKKTISDLITSVNWNAVNEYWFLYDVSSDTDDFIIQGDNDIETFSDINFDGIPLLRSFTGAISVSKTGEATESQDLLFIVAIPNMEE